MTRTLQGVFLERDDIASALTRYDRYEPEILDELFDELGRIPKRGAFVGSWSRVPEEPLAEVMIVRDEDYADTLAWLASFFRGLEPITQWCRVLPRSEATRIATRPERVSLGRMLGPWVGAIIAECSTQAGGLPSLRELPGSAAISSATFAAGRAAAVWNDSVEFGELARRHDELSRALRDASRPIPAAALVPVWAALSDRQEGSRLPEWRSLEPLASIIRNVVPRAEPGEPAELALTAALEARDFFDLPELTDCAKGPQQERVKALDRLGERLAAGPHSPAIDALLGLGASFIEPGAAVLPGLLRRHGHRLPLAPIWQGVFAGAWSPIRVLNDQNGLGRLVAKLLLADADLNSRPASDISYDELIRWVNPIRQGNRVELRGMSARSIVVEIMTGTAGAFSQGRAEHQSAPRAPSDRMEARPQAPERPRPADTRSLTDIDAMLTSLRQRVELLEQFVRPSQTSLDLPDPKDARGKRGAKTPRR